MSAGSPLCWVSTPDLSGSAEINFRSTGKLPTDARSRTSRPSSDSLPINAQVGFLGIAGLNRSTGSGRDANQSDAPAQWAEHPAGGAADGGAEFHPAG